MINTESILLIIYFSNLILLGINVTILGSFYIRKYRLDKKERNIHRKYQQTIETAQTEAEHLLQTAATKSAEIVKNTKYIQKKVESRLANSLETNLTDNTNKLNEVFSGFQQANKEYFDHMKNKLADFSDQHLNTATESILEEINHFAEEFKSQTITAQNQVGEELKEKSKNIQNELENYKKQRINELNNTINKIIYDTTKEVLSTAIPMEKHEELIMDALEKAKTQGVFNQYSMEETKQHDE